MEENSTYLISNFYFVTKIFATVLLRNAVWRENDIAPKRGLVGLGEVWKYNSVIYITKSQRTGGLVY